MPLPSNFNPLNPKGNEIEITSYNPQDFDPFHQFPQTLPKVTALGLGLECPQNGLALSLLFAKL